MGLRLEDIFLQSGAAFESAVFRCIASNRVFFGRDSVVTVGYTGFTMIELLFNFDVRNVEQLWRNAGLTFLLKSGTAA